MNFIDNTKLIESKNKALKSWSKHNFIFTKFSEVILQKVTELKSQFTSILVISADNNETISEISKLDYEYLFYFSQYRPFLKGFNLKKKKMIKIYSSFETCPFKNESFDLVICNFCFHNINKKKDYLDNLKRILRKNGLLICNYFGENSLIELKNSFLLTDQKVYRGSFLRFPKSITLVEFSQMLIQTGFKEIVTEKINYDIFYENVLSLLRDIKGMGETGFHSVPKKMGIKYYRELNNVYKQSFVNKDSKLKASCEIISSSCWKS